MSDSLQTGDVQTRFLKLDEFARLFEVLNSRGYEVIGPTIDQEAIVYGPLSSIDDLPRGWTDQQEPGRYRLVKRDDNAFFGYVVGPSSWKKQLFPPVATLTRADRTEEGWQFQEVEEETPRYAFLGVRAC
ncbi:MAG: sulfite reductase subunit A, partial [Planctomycetaceae bacterium]|nr:sulfite reductase subunit A [Planctomycetaceae bacterium]